MIRVWFSWRQLVVVGVMGIVWCLSWRLPPLQAADGHGAFPLVVQLPTNASGAPGSQVMLPVMLQGVPDQAVFSYQFTVRFDPLVLTGLGVNTANSLSAGWSIVDNHQTPGELHVAAFHTTPLAGSGRLLNLTFTVMGQASMQTALTWHTLLFNEGQPAAQADNGLFQVAAGTATPIPPSTPIPTATPPPRITTVPAQRASYLPFIQK